MYAQGPDNNAHNVEVPGIEEEQDVDQPFEPGISPRLALLTTMFKNTPYILGAGFAVSSLFSFADNAIVGAPLYWQKMQEAEDHAKAPYPDGKGMTDPTAITNYKQQVAWAYLEKTMADLPLTALYMSAYIALCAAGVEAGLKFLDTNFLHYITRDLNLNQPYTKRAREHAEVTMSNVRFAYDYYMLNDNPSLWFQYTDFLRNIGQNQQEQSKNIQLAGSYAMACGVIAFAFACVQLGVAQILKAENFISNQQNALDDMLDPANGNACGAEGTAKYDACIANANRIGIDKATENSETIFDLETLVTVWASYLAITVIGLPLMYWALNYFIGRKKPFLLFDFANFEKVAVTVNEAKGVSRALKNKLNNLKNAEMPNEENAGNAGKAEKAEKNRQNAIFSAAEIRAIITALNANNQQILANNLKRYVVTLDFTSFLNGIVWQIIGRLPLYTVTALTLQMYLTGPLALPPLLTQYNDDNDEFYDYAVALKPDGLSKSPADAQDYADMQSSTNVTANLLRNNTKPSGWLSCMLMGTGLIDMGVEAYFMYALASKRIIDLTDYKDENAKATYLRENPTVAERAKNLGRSVFIGGYVDLALANDDEALKADPVYQRYVARQAFVQTKPAPWLPSLSELKNPAMIAFTVIVGAVLLYTATGTQFVSKKFWSAYDEKYDSQKSASQEKLFNMMCLLVEQAYAHSQPLLDAALAKFADYHNPIRNVVQDTTAASSLDMTLYAVQLAIAAGMSEYMNSAQFQGNTFWWFMICVAALVPIYVIGASVTTYCMKPVDEAQVPAPVAALPMHFGVHNSGIFGHMGAPNGEGFAAVPQEDAEEGGAELGQQLLGDAQVQRYNRCSIM